MGSIASQITSLTIVYSIVYSDADQRNHQSSASLAFVRGPRWIPRTNDQSRGKCFHLMTSSCRTSFLHYWKFQRKSHACFIFLFVPVSDGTSRRQEFAQKAVNEIRRWHNWLYLQALEKKRPHEESVSIVEEFWKRFEHLAAANLDNLHVDNPVAYICIEKVVAQE